MKDTKPPKDREFMGYAITINGGYWDFFWWATKAEGVNGKSRYVDRQFFDMPKIKGWIEIPDEGGL